jgi:cytochrome c biogenesis protein
MKSFIKFFSSVKLAIVLLIVLTLASVLGTLIPQGRTVEEYAARYGQIAGFFSRIQLTRLYHSIWFLALLGFFALNIVICTLTRLAPKFRRAFRPHVRADAKGLQALKLNGRLKKNSALPEAKSDLVGLLKAAHYRVRETADASRTSLLARKKIWGIFGSDFVHLGLLVIIAGGIVSGLAGFRTELAFNEGDVVQVPRAGFELRLDKFTTEFYPDGNVKDWKSAMSVLEQKRPVLSKMVEVNHPLSYKSFNFYQTSYGWNWDNPAVELWAKKTGDAAFEKKMKLRLGERAPLGDKEETVVAVARFVPDFVLGEGNEPQTRSLQPNNPAALVEGFRGSEKIFSAWIFANYPDFSKIHGTEDTDLAFELKSFDARQYSVIEAARDPGTALIWAGCVLVMAGLGLAFYWPPWEIKVVLEETQGKTELVIGGLATKSRDAFAAEFEKLMASSRRPK